MHHPNLFKTTHQPYYVVAPDWTHISAGVRSVHYLCHALNQLGEEAYLAAAHQINPRLQTPRLTQDIVDWHVRVQQRTPIVVYPEIVKGNPLNGKTVVRWLLNRPGAIHADGDTTFPDSDMIFYYNSWMMPEGWQGHPLYMACIDPDEMPFGIPVEERTEDCVYGLRRRAAGHVYAPQHQGLFDLSDQVRSREDVSLVLQNARRVYAYEPSAITTDAIFSGCVAVWVKNPFMDFDPIKTDNVLLGYGQCTVEFGEEPSEPQITEAQRTLKYAKPQWEMRGIQHSWDTLDQFIRLTQSQE